MISFAIMRSPDVPEITAGREASLSVAISKAFCTSTSVATPKLLHRRLNSTR